MDEPFVIELNYKGVERAFEARLQVYGYSHRFHVDVEGVEVLFERDEEGRYRAMLASAILPPSAMPDNGRERENGHMMDAGLLQAIAEAIEHLLQ